MFLYLSIGSFLWRTLTYSADCEEVYGDVCTMVFGEVDISTDASSSKGEPGDEQSRLDFS